MNTYFFNFYCNILYFIINKNVMNNFMLFSAVLIFKMNCMYGENFVRIKFNMSGENLKPLVLSGTCSAEM